MNKLLIAGIAGLSIAGAGAAYAQVHDWKDLDKVHKHVEESIKEMAAAAAANHYDMAGHAKHAEELLHQVEKELHEAVEAAKMGK